MAMSNQVFATAQDSTSIRIQVVHSAPKQKIRLTGTATSNKLKKFDVNNFKNHSNTTEPVKLGSFGIHSTIEGNCRIEFNSANQFHLKHSNLPDTYLARYQISLDNKNIDIHSKTIQASSCNLGSKALTMRFLKSNAKTTYAKKESIQNNDPGYYWDTVMITVTAP